MDLNLLAGPAALSIAAVLAVAALWRAHVKDDDRDAVVIQKLTEAVAAFPAALRDLTTVVNAAAEREANRPKNGRADDR